MHPRNTHKFILKSGAIYKFSYKNRIAGLTQMRYYLTKVMYTNYTFMYENGVHVN